MNDDPQLPAYWTDPRTGFVYVLTPNSPSSMQEVVAYEPEGVLPDPANERTATQSLVNQGRIIIAYQPPLKVEASGPKNIFANQGEQIAVVCGAEGYQCESMTATVWVSDPGETAGLVDTVFPLATNIAGGGTPAANFGPTSTDPFTAAAAPGALGLPGNLLQQIEVLGYFIQGHEDVAFTIPFNMPVGQLIRLNAAGGSLKVKATLIPRYFQKFGGAASFQYIVAGTSLAADRQRNNAFDFPNLGAIAQNFTPDGIPQLGVQVQGYVGRGFVSPVPPQRVFWGAIDAGATQNTLYRCPVARGAQTVFLQCDASAVNNDPIAGAGFAGATLTMNFFSGNNGRRNGLNIPANTTVPLPADCTAVEVVNVTAGGALPVGVPFQLQYDVGF